MGDRTAIEWTDATWNPLRGCSRVSEGCRHCYAERAAARFAGPGQPYEGLVHRVGGEARWTGRVTLVAAQLAQPLRWRKPRRIFVNSMSDLFHESVPDAWIDQIFAVMALAPQHTFQVLTKRADRMRAYLSDPARPGRIARACTWSDLWPAGAIGGIDDPDDVTMAAHPLPNVWLGVSVENQEAADSRIPDLLATPAAIRFLSCEPLLEMVNLEEAWHGENALSSECWGHCAWCKEGYPPLYNCRLGLGDWEKGRSGIDWVIAGGESGPGARPMYPNWLRLLRDLCTAAGVPFFFKQWGEFAPEGLNQERWLWRPDGSCEPDSLPNGIGRHAREGFSVSYRVGKRNAGRTLDGRTWDELPAVAHG